MSKKTIKKTIFTIVILSILILSLIFFYRITSEDRSDTITKSKRIIKEKYEDIVYFDNSYLYARNGSNYDVYDYNGNRLYSFSNIDRDHIVSVSKKYFIVKDNGYHVYNPNFEKVISGNNIYGINENLIYVDNNIVNDKGEVLFYNIKNIKPYYNNKYFLIDNYFVNEKGKVLLVDYKIIKEKVNNNEIDYFIVKKDSKYYCFFPIVNNIIGDGFDKYFEYDDKIYIVSNNKIYMIYMNGLRKEITFTINKNINVNNIDFSNAVKKNEVLTIRDYYLGLLETDTNKFYKIMKTKKFSYKYIDNNHINISTNDKNYVYDLEKKEVLYSNHFDDIVIFNNNYKTIKINKKYYLLDDKDRRITYSNKQIILLDSKVKIGKVNKNISLFDSELHDGKRITVDNKTYYQYEVDNTKYIVSSNLKERYESKLYLGYMKDTIVELDKNKLCFYNKKKNKKYYYDLEDYKIVNDEIYKNGIILSNDNNIVVLGSRGNVIKRIKNVKLESITYNKMKQAVILVVEKERLFNKYKGSYVLK